MSRPRTVVFWLAAAYATGVEVFLTAHGWLSLATLSVLEIVLGIDNIIFIALLTNQVPPNQRARVRSTGIALALITRLLLLLGLSWVMTLVQPWFQIAGHEFSGRDLILLGGGLFLMAKATREVAHKVEIASRDDSGSREKLSTTAVLAQIVVLDIIFSLDSVVTAVGMANELVIMVTAMVLAVGVMLAFSGKIARFIQRHPSMQILALSFLILIGATLVVEGWGGHINKGYIYFAMCFALAVDSLQLWAQRKNQRPVPLHSRTDEPPAGR